VPDMVGVFSSWYADRRENVLLSRCMEILRRAADLALRRGAARWLDPLDGRYAVAHRGVADDASMHECLGELAALWTNFRRAQEQVSCRPAFGGNG
jgi:hypothetical protein